MNSSSLRKAGMFLAVVAALIILGVYLSGAFSKPAEEHEHEKGDFHA